MRWPDAIERSARSFGAEIRTDARVARTLVAQGRVRGVVLESGEEILAPLVVTTLHPRTAFLDHLSASELPDDFVQDIERWKTRSGVVKINLALSELPNFTADPGTELAEHHTGSVEMAPSIEYMERAFQDAREGRAAERPFSDGVIPTTFDKTLCPEGTHIMSLFTQWVPEGVERDAPHRGARGLRRPDDRLLRRGGPQLQGLHPPPRRGRSLRDGAGVRTDRRQHLPRGALAWISSSTCARRPATPTTARPIKGLYNGSSATHAGGGVCGIPGWQAAKAALADQKAAAGPRRPTARALLAEGERSGRRRTRPAAVRAMLEPRRIAVVGASARPGSFGDRLVAEVARSAAPVDLHLVNPRYDTVLGLPCVASLDDIDGPVDLVLLGVPDAAVEERAGRGRRGVGTARRCIYGSLFDGEHPGDGGLRHRVAAIARSAGHGPVRRGVHGVRQRDRRRPGRRLRRAGTDCPAGPVAFITHSGSVFSAVLRTRRHLGFTLVVSAGQELVTTTASYLDYALDVEETRVVGLLLETLREPDLMRAALGRAAEQGVAVVALTVGGSTAGRAMVAAHSGALAGADGAWEALFDAYGVIRVGDLDEMTDTLELFAAGRRAAAGRPAGSPPCTTPAPSGRWWRTWPTRSASPSPPSAPATRARLAGLARSGPGPGQPARRLGHRGRHRRPVRRVPAGHGRRRGGVGRGAGRRPGGGVRRRRVLSQRRHRAPPPSPTKPVVVLSNLGSAIDPVAAARVRAAGVPVLEGTRSGLSALGHLLDHPERRNRAVDRARHRPGPAPGAVAADGWPTGPLSGADAFALLADYGIPAAECRTVSSAAEAVVRRRGSSAIRW